MTDSTWNDNTASSSSKQPSRLTNRKQNVTCDACRFRKVKCDRRQKVENKSEFESEDSIACSVCTSHGLRCTFTQPETKKLRQGKRILAYRQAQQHTSPPNGAASAANDTQRRNSESLSLPSSPPFGAPRLDDSATSAADARRRSASNRSEAPYPIMTSRGLFDVEGLTKPLLDACFQAYFKYYAPTIHSLQTDVFASRYEQYFKNLELNNGFAKNYWQRSDKEQESEEKPLSETLILAVACTGASLLEPPIADYGSSSRFKLQDKLALRFQELIDVNLSRRLEYEGADVVEACYILADPFLHVLGNKPYASPFETFQIKLSSFEGCIRLLFKLGINKRPRLRRHCPPGDIRQYESSGQYITKMEVFQRSRIFWTCFGSDSFRSMGTNAGVLIGSDAYDWDLPRFVPRKDGSFDSLFLCQREEDPNVLKVSSDVNATKKNKVVCLQANHFASFDIMHMQTMMRLAFVIRTVSIKLISPQSQGRSVLLADVERAINALSAWYQQLPSSVTWEAHAEKLINPGPGDDLSTELRYALKSFFLETLYHSNVIHVWNCVDTFGTRTEDEVAEATNLLASNLQLGDGGTLPNTTQDWPASLLPAESLVEGKDDNEVEIAITAETIRQRMDHMTAQCFIRVAKVGKEAARFNLLRASRLVFVHLFRSYTMWGCTLAKKLAMEKALSQGGKSSLVLDVPPGFTQHDYILKCVEDLIYCLSKVDSCESAVGQAKGLQEELDRARDFCQFGQSMDTIPETINESYGRDAYGKGILESPANTSSLQQEESPAAMQIADLQSLSNADVQWLQQYLQFSNTAFSPNNTTTTTTSGSDSQNTSQASPNDKFNMTGMESVYMNDVAPADQDQWTQFLTYSDAQNWADTQWQGGASFTDALQF